MLKLPVRPPTRSLGIRLLVAAVILFALVQLHLSYNSSGKIYQSVWKWSSGTARPGISSPYNGTSREGCEGLTGFDRVVVTIKTGATEAEKKIPTQLKTSLRCAPHVYIFSDMAQTIGESPVYDALDTISPLFTQENPDFDLYRKQYEIGDPGRIMAELSGMKDARITSDLAAWTLDKYKNMHIIEKIWAMKPEMDFYLHIDADTYVVWSSLITWIQRLDPSKKSYMGSLALINGMPFGHGGSGYLMSREAMRAFAVTHNGTAAKWDSRMHDECCGDWTLAQALKEYSMPLKNSWPTVNGETQSTIPFGDDHWCQPLATLHHISNVEAEQLAAFEAKRENKSSPLLYSELFNDLVFDTIPTRLASWDNLSKNVIIAGVSSAEACFSACQDKPACLQARWNGEQCFIGTKHVSFGKRVDGHNGEGVEWESMWNRTRIAQWAAQKKECGKPKFPFQERPSRWLAAGRS
ncbi:hypothetical protein LZ554_005800 [Drepanopeziza brunnea f. sp. 'monogermtubi']|nr:hypothetical protein LZ554_005800 [Drepanopeziza brunnea f. sp. 'monogermtubi']